MKWTVVNPLLDGVAFWHIYQLYNTVNSRYLEVVGTIFYKFKLPEVQINLHFGKFELVKEYPTPTNGWRKY